MIDEVFDSEDVLERTKTTPARTEDDVQDLLKALNDKFQFEGDGKWARMTEEFNARAVDQKSKQWIKRAAGKLEPKTAAEEAPADKELSRRQQKKVDQKEKASEAALKAVVKDMPEEEEEKAEFIRVKTVEHFWECIEAGDYPEEEAETMFGVKMGDEIGELVYASWRLLQSRKMVKKAQVVEALANGQLPLSFRKWLEDIPPGGHSPHTMILSQSPDKRAKIPWDPMKLKRCAKPSCQVGEVEASIAAAAAAPAAASAGKAGGYAAASVPSEDRYKWSQQNDEVEVLIPVDTKLVKKDIILEIKPQELIMKAPLEMRLPLFGPVLQEGSGWTLSKGQVVVTLEKKEPKTWPTLLAAGK